MSDDLKKIEEQHLPYGDHPGCPEYQQLGDPCNVVKLARALAKFGNTSDEDGDRSVERVLREVAGENP